MSDGSVTIEVSLTKEQLEKGLKSIKNDLNQLKTPSQNISQTLANGFNKIGDAATKAGSFITKTFTTPVIGILTASAIKAKSFITTYESAINLFEKRLGSRTSANDMYQSLLNIAKASTFAQENMIKSGQTLIAMGVDSKRTAKLVQLATDAIAGMGGSGAEIESLSEVFGKMSNQVKLHTDDLNQLALKGLPVWDILAKKYGKSKDAIQEMASKGLLPATETLDFLTDALQGNIKGFEQWSIAGTAASQKGGTLKGALDGLNSSFRSFALNLLGMNINKGQTANYKKLISIFSKLGQTVEKIGAKFSFVGDWISKALNVVDSALDKFQKKLDSLSPKQLEMIAKAILGLATAGPGLLIFGKVSKTVGGLINAFSTGGSAIKTFGSILSFLASPAGLIVLAIAAITTALVILYNTSENFRNSVNKAFETVKNAVINAWNESKGPLGEFINTFKEFWNKIEPIRNFLVNVLGVAFQLLGIIVSQVIEKIVEKLNFWIKVATIVVNVWIGIITFFTTTIPNAFNTFVTHTGNMVNAVTNWFAQLNNRVKTWLQNVVNIVINWGREMTNKGKEGAQNLVNTIENTLKALPRKSSTMGKRHGAGVNKWAEKQVRNSKRSG